MKILRSIRRRLTGKGRRIPLAQRYPQYEIGTGSYGDLAVHGWEEGAALRIGAYTSIARGAQVLLGGGHRIDWVTTYPFNVLWPSARHKTGHPTTKGDIVIGSDVWIGAEAVILSGVTIGHGAVIGARSVVAKDVPPYAICVGNPARLVKYRFAPEVIERLLRVAWWNWTEAEIQRAMDDLLSPGLEAFLEKAERGAYRG
jgi:acetyltransferase-like isoleucine patch superfamily enzyme